MKRILFITILFFLGIGFFPSQSQALTISPAKIFLIGDPGDTITTKMGIQNDLPRVTTFYPVFESYTTGAGGSEPIFIPESSGFPTWITSLPSKVTLGEKEKATVVITIKIPKDAEPGGHSAAIFWSSAPPKGIDGSKVGIVTRVGALVLLEVSGDVSESGNILEFKSIRNVYRSRPVGFTYSIENTGNVHLRPRGEILIKNFFGKTIEILDANPGGTHVLSDNTRKFFAENWEANKDATEKISKYDVEGTGFIDELRKELKGFALGYYKANLYLEFGREEIQIIKASSEFWVLPWRILLLSSIILSIILLITTKGIKNYNRRIVAKTNKRV